MLTEIKSCSELSSWSHDQQCSESSGTGSESSISSFSSTSSPASLGKKCFFTVNIWHNLELTALQTFPKRTSLTLKKAKNATSFPLTKFNLKTLFAFLYRFNLEQVCTTHVTPSNSYLMLIKTVGTK